MEIFFSPGILSSPVLSFLALSLCDTNRACILGENMAGAESRKYIGNAVPSLPPAI